MKIRTAIATATLTAVLATAGVSLAGAASGSGSSSTTAAPPASSPAPAPAASGARVAPKLRLRRAKIRKLLRGAGGVVTTTIGIDRKTLRTALRSGQTVAQIATAHGADPQDVINALVAAATKKIDAAVSAHRIDAARAQRIEQRLPQLVTRLVDNWHPRRLRAAGGSGA